MALGSSNEMGTDCLTCEITRLHQAVHETQKCRWVLSERHPPGVGMVCCQHLSPALVKCQALWPIVLCHCSTPASLPAMPGTASSFPGQAFLLQPALGQDLLSHCRHIVAGHVAQWLVQPLCMWLHLAVNHRAQEKKHIYIYICYYTLVFNGIIWCYFFAVNIVSVFHCQTI